MVKYEYVVDNSTVKLVDEVTAISTPEGFEKEDGEYLKTTELEELVLVETRPVITTKINVYVTGYFTNGGDSKFVELKVEIPVTYTAGEESAAVNMIEEEAVKAISNFDANFTTDVFNITSIDPDLTPMMAQSEESIDIEFVAKERPTIIGGGDWIEPIQEPLQETGSFVLKAFTGVVNTAAKAVTGVVKGIGKLFGRFFR